MEGHFHIGVEHLFLGALGIAAMFHILRVLAALIGKKFPTVGSAIGGFFTFAGAA